MGVGTFLITDILCITLAFFETIGNGAVLYLFITKKLDSKRNLRIFLYLAVSDFLFGILICPYIIYMISLWQPDQLDYNPMVMAVLGSPIQIFFKVTGGLSCGAAVERIMALYFPIFFRRMNHIIFSNIVITLSIVLSLFDLTFSMISYNFYHIINCASIGCFVNEDFRFYWGISNLLISSAIVILSFIVFLKVRQMKTSSSMVFAKHEGNKNFPSTHSRQTRLANSSTSGVLISSLFCSAIPSLIVSLYESITKESFFGTVGPFYVFTLLASGLMNSCIFLIWNHKPNSNTNSNNNSHRIIKALSEGAIPGPVFSETNMSKR